MMPKTLQILDLDAPNDDDVDFLQLHELNVPALDVI